MARTITDEEIKLSIIINGNPAQKQILDLEKSTISLKNKVSDLNFERKLVEKQLGKESDEYKKLTKEINSNTKEIEKNEQKLKELVSALKVSDMTMAQLQAKARTLSATLRHLIPNTPDHDRYTSELREINTRMAELRSGSQSSQSSLRTLADGFNRYAALGASVIASLTGVVISVQKIIDINGKLSDTQADVMKTTGMTKDEVDELTKSFGLLETRTSRIDLLKIAEQGGRIGIAKADIQDFVKTMNMANVALGDSFTGGVEEVANKLGKLKFLFEETKDANIDTAYNAIGSAINDLGANGVASEANITEFATRLGSLPNVLKPTIKEALALGAAFEESGIEAEVSSRAYNIFMKQASTESAKFAKVMGISEQAVKKMINTNPLEFMMKFAEGMKNMDATQTARTLDLLGVNADGANKVIGAMGNNMDRFRELIDISNNSFNEGSSLFDEYNVKNTNLAATLEKIGKSVNGWFSSENFNNWLFNLVNGFALLIGATEDADKRGQKWRNTLLFTAKVIAIVISAMVTSIGTQKLYALWANRAAEGNLFYTMTAKARAVADGIVKISTLAYITIQNLLIGNTMRASAAFRLMTATMMTTPWGFILGAIAAIGTAYLMFRDSAKEAATAQSMMVQHSRDVDSQLEKESTTFISLIKIIQDKTASVEAKSLALKKAKEIGGEYTKGLTLENAATFEGKKMIDAYIGSLRKKIELQVYQAQIDKLVDEIAERKNKKVEDEVDSWDRLWISIKSAGQIYDADAAAQNLANSRKTKALKDLQNQLGYTQKQMEEYLKLNPDVIKNIDTGGNTDFNAGDKTPTNKKNPNTSQEEINRFRLESDSRYNDLLLKNRRQLEDDKIALMFDGFEKELAIENLRYQREIEDLERQKVHTEEIAKLDEEIAKAKASGDITLYNAKLVHKKVWSDRNKELDAQINQIIETKESVHLYKLGAIREKEAENQLKRLSKQFEGEKLIRETAYLNELVLLGDNQAAKDALKKNYEASELKSQEDFLNKLLSENQAILEGFTKNVDFDLLPPDEKEKFKDNVDELLNKIAHLKQEIGDLKNGGKSKFDVLSGQGTDVLGISPEQWATMFQNFDSTKDKILALIPAITAIQSTWEMFSKNQANRQDKEMKLFEKNQNAIKSKYDKRLKAGVITQEQYDRQVKKLDDEKEKYNAEQEYKKAKRDRTNALFQIASNTAVGIMKAYAMSPATLGMPWSGIIAGMGIIQASLVPKVVKGFENGLYPIKREQDGKMFNARFGGTTRSGLVNNPTYFLTGENGPEMIIDSKAYSQISPATKNALLNELRGIKGFQDGFYNQQNKRFEIPTNSDNSGNSVSSNDAIMPLLLQVIQQNTDVMLHLKENGVIGKFLKTDIKSAKDMQDMIDSYNKLKNKNRI